MDQLESLPQGYKDRTGLLILLGVVEMAIGGVTALLALAVIVSSSIAASNPAMAQMGQGPGQMIAAASIYLFASVFFLAMGFGSCMCRRWARALMLIASWATVIWGSISIVSMILFMAFLDFEKLMATTPGAAGANAPPPGFMQGIIVIMTLFMGFFLVLMPLLFALAYSSKHVKATCEWKDPRIRWTDKCPLPVLALSLFMLAAALMTAPSAFAYQVIVFVVVIKGPAAILASLVLVAVMLALAWGHYKLKPAAWWGSLALSVIGTIGFAVGMSRTSWSDIYREMGYSDEMIEMIEAMQFFTPGTMSYMMIAMSVIWVVYLLFVRRYYKPGAFTPPDTSPPPLMQD